MDKNLERFNYSSKELGECFIDSFAHVLSNMSDDSRKDIYAFVLELVGGSNLYTRLSPDPFAAMMAQIYESTSIRDFISMLQSVFLGRWLQGRGKELLYSLIDDLSLSMSYDLDAGLNGADTQRNELVKLCAIHEPIRDSLVTATHLTWLIQANPILISIILITQYVNLESFGFKTSPDSKE